MRKYTWILFALLLPLQLNAQSFNTRFSTTFYSYERHLSDSESQNHLRLYQNAQITVGKMAGNRLSFHFYGLLTQDLAESADDDPIPRLYNTYFQWRERKGVLQRIKVGRQRVYSGVAYGSIDGVDVNLRLGKGIKLGGYVGTLVPFSTKIETSDWDEGHSFGLRLGTNNLFGTRVLLSFMQRNKEPVDYEAPGRYTQKIIEIESLAQRVAGIDVYRKITKTLNAYGRFDYDLEQERVRRAQFELKLAATAKLELAADFYHRAPFIEANSIFAVFEQSTTQDVGLRANYRLAQGSFITGNFGYQIYDGDEALRFGFGLRNKYGSLGYNFRKGYGGQNNGIYASTSYPVTPQIALLASTGFSRYSLFNEDADLNTSLTGSVGVNYRHNKLFSLNVLGQGIRNRFMSSDFRLMVKANYWFLHN